jgi:GNAT superfamily N-acetyltransferase
MIELPLSKANRLRIARAFGGQVRVDISIDCVIEDQMGKAFVDDLAHPTAFLIEMDGFFCYFAGDASGPGGRGLVASATPPKLLMGLSPDWLALVGEIHGDRLIMADRYIFSSENLSVDHLERLLEASPFKDGVRRIDVDVATQIADNPQSFVQLTAYDTPEDFVERGIGFCVVEEGSIVGAAYASLVCSTGIEISLFVLPDYRRRGVATALCCHLLTFCLERNMDPHWDAANPESCALAMKLGYKPTGSYEAYFMDDR